MSLPRDTTNCWMTGPHIRSTSNHNILAAHLYPVGEFRDAAGGVVPGELLQLGHECRIVLDIRSRLVQNRPSA